MTQVNEDIDSQVVVNGEGQHSVWPAGKPLPLGWREAGFRGRHDDCLHHIAEVWTDQRPLSVRPEAPAADPVHEAVVTVWNEVLGRSDVDGDTDFFEAGGYSLLAMQAVARLDELLGTRVKVRLFFDHPVVDEFVAEMRIRLLAAPGRLA